MKLPYWRLLLPLLVQVAIPLSLVAPYYAVITTGRTVYLRAIPVDPYDPLRGYSQVLGYEFGQRRYLESLPGGKNLTAGETVYVVFSAPVQQELSLPWQPVRVSATLPQDLAPQEVVLKGRLKNGRIDYGIEEIYIPENQRDRMNAQIAEASQREQLLVEVKVDAGGRALVRAIWLHGQRHQF